MTTLLPSIVTIAGDSARCSRLQHHQQAELPLPDLPGEHQGQVLPVPGGAGGPAAGSRDVADVEQPNIPLLQRQTGGPVQSDHLQEVIQ